MSMHIPEAEARKLAEADAQRYGNGFYRKRADGLAEHLPASSVVVIAAQQAEPASNAELLTDQEIAEYSPGDITIWAYEDMLYFARQIEAAVLARTAKSSHRLMLAESEEENVRLRQRLYDAGLMAGQRAGVAETEAARDVLAERQRQISAEGWTLEHDDAHAPGTLSQAAGCYIDWNGWEAECQTEDSIPISWPWNAKWWKPSDERRNLVKAGALILAEIERLDRRSAAPTQQQEN